MAESSQSPQPEEQHPVASATSFSLLCPVCNESMDEGQECLGISECGHSFHRLCIETRLASSSICPTCKRSCELSELRAIQITSKPTQVSRNTNKKSRGRGAMSRSYNTRSTTRTLFQESQYPLLDNSSGPNGDPLQTPNRNHSISNRVHVDGSPLQNTTNPNIAVNNNIDYNQLNQMIEATLTRLLQNHNFFSRVTTSNNNNQTAPSDQQHCINQQPKLPSIPNSNINNNQSNTIPYIDENFPYNNRNTNPAQIQGNPYSNFPTINISPNTHFTSSNQNMKADKITSIINNWNLKFDGSPNGLTIEEFLYRVKTLTRDTFNNDFTVICSNLNTLLTGKARDWYWRYHKQVQSISWESFCDAILNQYKQQKSSFDLQEELRSRKQRPGESYDSFFDALSLIADKLIHPISEEELIVVISRNLRPEIRQDLLYVPIRSLSHLRKLVQMRETFLSDEYVRKNLSTRNVNSQAMPRRYVAPLEGDEPDNEDINGNPLVEAIHKTGINPKCWNCDEVGHHWQDCLEERTVFCYGCGAKKTYKPQCTYCLSKSQSKNLKPVVHHKDQA